MRYKGIATGGPLDGDILRSDRDVGEITGPWGSYPYIWDGIGWQPAIPCYHERADALWRDWMARRARGSITGGRSGPWGG